MQQRCSNVIGGLQHSVLLRITGLRQTKVGGNEPVKIPMQCLSMLRSLRFGQLWSVPIDLSTAPLGG